MESRVPAFCCYPSRFLVRGMVPWFLNQGLVQILVEVVEDQEGNIFLNLHCANEGEAERWLEKFSSLGARRMLPLGKRLSPIVMDGSRLERIRDILIRDFGWEEISSDNLFGSFRSRAGKAPERKMVPVLC